MPPNHTHKTKHHKTTTTTKTKTPPHTPFSCQHPLVIWELRDAEEKTVLF